MKIELETKAEEAPLMMKDLKDGDVAEIIDEASSRYYRHIIFIDNGQAIDICGGGRWENISNNPIYVRKLPAGTRLVVRD